MASADADKLARHAGNRSVALRGELFELVTLAGRQPDVYGLVRQGAARRAARAFGGGHGLYTFVVSLALR